MGKFKAFIRAITPKQIILIYHRVVSFLAAMYFRFPSREMLVIGVTGTNGKSSTCHLITHILKATEHKVGMATTVEFVIGDKRWLNNTKMTMQGRFGLQRLLRKMADAGVKYAVIEVSSEGLVQYRADYVDFDIAVLTNLTPEHIASHGSFENYKHAKGKLFASLSHSLKKYSRTENGVENVYADKGYWNASVSEQINKTIIVNGDDPHADYYLSFDAQEKYVFSTQESDGIPKGFASVCANNIRLGPDYSTFSIGNVSFRLPLPGMYNVYNALGAIAVGLTRGIGFATLARLLSEEITIPGRFERIDAGQDFQVIVDYAPEIASLEAVYGVIKTMEKQRLIHVLGACGGGRDAEKRPILGEMAGNVADIVIVTNEDPYDDDPMVIIDAVAEGAVRVGKQVDENLFKILDRKKAIAHALSIAQTGDVVLITGKGAEQAMCVAGGKKIPWDDRSVVREILQTLN